MTSVTDPALELATRDASDLAVAIERARDLAGAALAESSRRVYRSAWRRFTAWAAASGLAPLPAAPATVAAYLGQRADELAPRSFGVVMAAIALAHKLAGLPSPTTDPAVRYTLRGHRRVHGLGARRVLAIRVVDLARMLPPGDRPLDVRDRALLLLGFAAALRRAELVALDREHVEVTADGLIVHIARSKTDPEGRGFRLGVPYGRDPSLCAVRAVLAWLATLDANTTGAGFIDSRPSLFRTIDRHGRIGARLSGRAVCLVVKRHGGRVGLDADKLGGHSLRAGFATEAAARGVSEAAICRQTRHRSAVVRDYIRLGSLFIDNPAASVL